MPRLVTLEEWRSGKSLGELPGGGGRLLSPAKNLITHSATVVVLLSAALLAEAFWFAGRDSLTYDETIYLNLSLRSVRERRLDSAFMTLGVAPLPALLTYAGPLLFTTRTTQPSPHRWEAPANAPQLIRAPRFLNSLLVGVPLVVTVFLWLHRRRGLTAATLGGGLVALSPTLVAHAALATTDASLALFSTLGMAAIAWFATAPSAARLLVCAVAVAAAMSAKYSGVFLLPVAAGVFLLSSVRRQSEQRGTVSARRALREFIVHSALLACLVLPLWWGGHLFAHATPQELAAQDEGSRTASLWPPTDSPRDFVMSLAPIVGIQRQLQHNREGGDAFLMGERSTSGWWYYFPLVFLFKSTPAELALALFVLIAAGVAAGHPWRTLTALDSSMQCLLLAAGVFTGLLLTSHLNLGHRYMIPLYPVVIIAACDRLAARLGSRRAWLTAATVVLLASQAWSSLTIAPHYLAYVNRFSGGPENGWRLLADSSLDWGQDLPDLRAYLDARHQEPAAIKYFGSVLPEAYGVRADDIEHLRKRPEEYAVLALSATYLNGLHLGDRDPFKEFRRLEPIAQVGYSIMVYDLRRPGALFAFREALKVIH